MARECGDAAASGVIREERISLPCNSQFRLFSTNSAGLRYTRTIQFHGTHRLRPRERRKRRSDVERPADARGSVRARSPRQARIPAEPAGRAGRFRGARSLARGAAARRRPPRRSLVRRRDLAARRGWARRPPALADRDRATRSRRRARRPGRGALRCGGRRVLGANAEGRSRGVPARVPAHGRVGLRPALTAPS